MYKRRKADEEESLLEYGLGSRSWALIIWAYGEDKKIIKKVKRKQRIVSEGNASSLLLGASSSSSMVNPCL